MTNLFFFALSSDTFIARSLHFEFLSFPQCPFVFPQAAFVVYLQAKNNFRSILLASLGLRLNVYPQKQQLDPVFDVGNCSKLLFHIFMVLILFCPRLRCLLLKIYSCFQCTYIFLLYFPAALLFRFSTSWLVVIHCLPRYHQS